MTDYQHNASSSTEAAGKISYLTIRDIKASRPALRRSWYSLTFDSEDEADFPAQSTACSSSEAAPAIDACSEASTDVGVELEDVRSQGGDSDAEVNLRADAADLICVSGSSDDTESTPLSAEESEAMIARRLERRQRQRQQRKEQRLQGRQEKSALRKQAQN